MNHTGARLEFRTFAPSLGRIAEEMRRRSDCERVEEGLEAYLVSTFLRDHNIKIRDGKLSIKQLLGRQDDLEQWKPTLEQSFPIAPDLIAETLIPLLAAESLDSISISERNSPQELLEKFSRPEKGVFIASVFKRRFRFEVGDCPSEFDEVFINGAAIESVAIESEDRAALDHSRAILGLGDCENVSYPLAVKRVLGLEPLPVDAWYRFREQRDE